MRDNTRHYVNIIKSAGYRVFMRNPQRDEWCYFTDGVRIGYAQWPGWDIVASVSSVHVPNNESGKGFRVAEYINAESLRAALDCHAPEWASARQRASVRKYRDWKEFHTRDSWNAQYVEV